MTQKRADGVGHRGVQNVLDHTRRAVDDLPGGYLPLAGPASVQMTAFSGWGPTDDGRIKPDLVAPGEKIEAPTPDESLRRKDGTSMAAPHVSGAAAMLMARHREFIGQPDRVKQVLCSTATCLGRERYFQGAGMLDVLRAIQSV